MKILALVLAFFTGVTAPATTASTVSANTGNTPAADMVSATEVQSVDTENEEDLPLIRGEVIELDVNAETETINEETIEVEDTEVEDTEEAMDWSTVMLADVEDGSGLNIRTEASEDADLAGRLYRGCGAEVIEQGEEWTLIQSGSVTGYVKSEYCLFGEDAAFASVEYCDTVATATEGGIRVRSEATTESSIVTVLAEGDEIIVDTDSETVDGWVPVIFEDETVYVNAEFVDVDINIEEATTAEELRAQQEAIEAAERAKREAEEAEAAKKAAAASASSSSSKESSSSSTSSSKPAVSASTDDLTLLAALIQCEAGGEPYAGQVAVGAVVMNRVRSGSYPNSISGVIYQSGQFGPVSSGKLSRVLSSGNIQGSCVQAAQEALGGADNTGGAKSFHAGTSGFGTVIGNQIFY